MSKKTLKISRIALVLSMIFAKPSFSVIYAQDLIQDYHDKQAAKSQLNADRYDSSMYRYEKVGNDLLELRKVNEYIESQTGIADRYLFNGEINKAKEVLEETKSFVLKESEEKYSAVGKLYTLLGYCYLGKEEFTIAENYTKKGINLNINHFGFNNSRVASSYYTLGLVCKSNGRYDKSLESFHQALAIQSKSDNASELSRINTFIMIGSVYDDKNSFDSAITYYNLALNNLQLLKQTISTSAASCYLNMMSSLNNKGEFISAVEYGKKALETYTALALSEHANVASTYGKLGEIYTTLGDYEKAKEYLLRSIDIFTSKYPHKKSALGALFIRLGDVYKRTGEMKTAIEYSQKGIALHEQAYGEYHPQVGFMYEQVAGVYVDAKRFNDAIMFYRKAITSRERVVDSPSRNDIAQIYIAIANVYVQQKRFDSASVALMKAKDIQDRSIEKNTVHQAKLQQSFGDFYSAQKRQSDALLYYHSAIQLLTQQQGEMDKIYIPSLDNIPNKVELVELIGKKAKTFEQLYLQHHSIHYLRSAFEHYNAGLDVVDQLRREYFSEGSKLQLAEISSSVYRNASRTAIQLYRKTKDRYYLEQAFLAADRSKGNVLLEKMIASDAKHFSGIPDSLLAAEHELQGTIVRTENQMMKLNEKNNGNDSVAYTDARTLYFNLKRQYQAMIEDMERNYAKYYELKHARYSLTVPELQVHLEPKSALIEYLVDNDKIYVFIVSKNSFDVVQVNNTQKIKELSQQFSAALKSYNTEEYCVSGYALYSALFRPLQSLPAFAQATSIKIIPDGFLFYIPFEALPVQRYSPRNIDFTKLQYVISNYTVTYSYSAAFDMKLSQQKEQHRTAPMSFAGFAPVFRDTTKNGDFFANRTSVKESGIADVRSITLDGRTFNELKYSEDEVVSISNSFTHRSFPSKNFLHADATEHNFKTFAPLYDIVHVATHGFINEKTPNLSAVLFSQPKTQTEDEDGILYLNETFALKLKAQLVVLSSCESGVGKLVEGEGMIALSRSLFYAGAKNIIFSLWKVSDKQTYLLMDECYKHIVAGRSYASSLRSAKLSMIAAKETAFPSKWSGFVLVGW